MSVFGRSKGGLSSWLILKGDLVQHERFGIGRVETTAPDAAPDCEVFSRAWVFIPLWV
jgi:hypothetical protein